MFIPVLVLWFGQLLTCGGPRNLRLQFAGEHLLFFIASHTGLFCLLPWCRYNGLPPDNAVRISKWLGSTADSGAAAGVVFAVLGVGNSQWVTYQAFPR